MRPHQATELERDARAGAHPDHDDPPANREATEVVRDEIAPDELQDHVVLAPDARVGAECLEPLGAVTRERGDACAGSDAELQARDADPAGSTGDEQPLARRQPGLGEQCVVGGREDFHEAAGFRIRERSRCSQRMALVNGHQLGVAAAAE